jgi:molybdopterin-guanine dinucleotide biosynthesis protein A
VIGQSYDAVILAGGAGERLGGVSKADLVVNDERLLDTVLRAADGATTRVVVGAVDVPYGVIATMEEPPGSGPAAGLEAGLDAVTEPSPWTLVLACDLPGAVAAVGELLAAVAEDDAADGFCLLHDDGSVQWLYGVYRTSSLRTALARFDSPTNLSLRRLLANLALVGVRPIAADVSDIDTTDDLARWGGTGEVG